MNEPALLIELRARDVRVWADGDQLKCDAPSGVLSPELLDRLRQCKSEILGFLSGPAELSFAQQRLWFLDQMAPGGAAYVMPKGFEMRGALDEPALERALAVLFGRHEALRTVVVNAGERPLQVVSDAGTWQLPTVDLGAEANPRQRLAQLLGEEAFRGFDLAQGPLFRARLYRVAADTHVLLLTMHHIVSDGWSWGVLIRELGEIYGQLVRGQTPALPALAFRYCDFARWQRDRLQGEVLQGLLAHWRSRLAGAPQVLDLPTDRPRTAMETFRGAVYLFELPLELANGLRGLARREGATLFMTLLAGFALLLSRYSGQQELLVGTPVANRNRTEIEDLVGIFINTLVLRADMSGEISVREHLRRMREVCLDAYAHEDLPFEQLVEELRPERDVSRNPVFQVMFAQNTPQASLELPGLVVAPVALGRTASQVDLSLTMQETPKGLDGIFEYATDLFDESTIVRMAGHLRTIFEGMIATPERRVGDLPLLTEAERHQMLVEWNDTKTDYPAEASIQDLFEAHAARTPEAIAVVHEDRQLTYAELNARANQLARHLVRHGVGSEVMVGLCVQRSLDMVVGILGILKAGGAYVPLDPDHPASRLIFMLEDTGARVLLTQAQLRDRLPANAARTISMDADWPQIGLEAKDNLGVDVKAGNLAYVIYTSGSTGKPKGVMIEHRAVCNQFTALQKRYGLNASNRMLQFASITFDMSVEEIFGALLSGATLVLRTDSWVTGAEDFFTLCKKYGVSVANLPPVFWQQIVQEEHAELPTELRQIMIGGDTVSPQALTAWFKRTRHLPTLFNAYGPTETTVNATIHEARVNDSSSQLIGRPIANTRIYILDAQKQPVPVGVAGELYIGGTGVARGYLNRPELTTERFLSDPFNPEVGARMYRTGDLARYLPEGNIEFLGRIDHQVKLRGHRIELGEIETVLAEHPDLRQAVVYLWMPKVDDVRLVACCVPAKAGVFAPIGLRKHLRARLPDYMVPQYFLPMTEIPLTPNGKIDRRNLPKPVILETGIGQHEVPVDQFETEIARIWTDLIGPTRPIGRGDKFFEMGGHSLLGIRALKQMENRFGVKLEVRILFQESLAEIAARCRSQHAERSGAGLLAG
ncbi:MAG: amino acid adenylation domain-containing protein [Burkholderiales bacterium]